MTLQFAVVGDSLTQGFQDGAISAGRALWSFPAQMARALGLSVGAGARDGFRVPQLPGPGLPLDIVQLLYRIRSRTGDDVSLGEWFLDVLPEVACHFDELETFYESTGASRGPGFSGAYHNLGLYGLTVFESLHLTGARCESLIKSQEGWLRDDPFGTPSGAKYRAAQMVLNPDGLRPHATVLDNLHYLFHGHAELGIAAEPPDALILWLGANDCLGTVVGLTVREMPTPAPTTVEGRHGYNLNTAAQFAADFDALLRRVDAILATHPVPVFVGTVPDVTIPPLAKGIGELHDDVFDYYVRFFVEAEREPPFYAAHLNREQVRCIQRRIGEFNAHIRRAVEARPNYHLADIAAVLQRLAVRRSRRERDEGGPLTEFYRAKGRPDHPLLSEDIAPTPSLLMLRVDGEGRRTRGGLTSLDGVHPTTVGYGIAAEVFLEAMQGQGLPVDPSRIDWPTLIAQDRLLRSPPPTWHDLLRAAEGHPLLWDILFRSLSTRTS